MPIRHCHKCGLKVLVEEEQGLQNPFYCQRCASEISASPGGASLPAPAGPAGTTLRPRTVASLTCPSCGAKFKGKLPQKVARGSCPSCSKVLLLSPDGTLEPADGATATPELDTAFEVQRMAASEPLASAPLPSTEAESLDASLDAALGMEEQERVDRPVARQPKPTVARSSPPTTAARETIRKPPSQPKAVPAPETVIRPSLPALVKPDVSSRPTSGGKGRRVAAILLLLLPWIVGGVASLLSMEPATKMLQSIGERITKGYRQFPTPVAPPPRTLPRRATDQ